MEALPRSAQIEGLAPMIDIRTLASYLGVPVATVYDWRTRRVGPIGYRFGKHVMFSIDDVRDWVELQKDPSDGRRSHPSRPGLDQ